MILKVGSVYLHFHTFTRMSCIELLEYDQNSYTIFFVYVYVNNNVDNDEAITLSCLTMTMDHLACY